MINDLHSSCILYLQPSGTLYLAEASWFHRYETKQQKRLAAPEQQTVKCMQT
jgi:hypothetical protein